MNNTTNTKKGTDGQTHRRQKRFAIAEALGDLESNLSFEKLFIEIAFPGYFSRLLSNIQSE